MIEKSQKSLDQFFLTGCCIDLGLVAYTNGDEFPSWFGCLSQKNGLLTKEVSIFVDLWVVVKADKYPTITKIKTSNVDLLRSTKYR
jgi:hypothetical protein